MYWKCIFKISFIWIVSCESVFNNFGGIKGKLFFFFGWFIGVFKFIFFMLVFMFSSWFNSWYWEVVFCNCDGIVCGFSFLKGDFLLVGFLKWGFLFLGVICWKFCGGRFWNKFLIFFCIWLLIFFVSGLFCVCCWFELFG